MTHEIASGLPSYHCFGDKPLSKPILNCFQLDHWENSTEIWIEIKESSVQENQFKNVICKMAAILSRPWCVNSLWPGDAIWRYWNCSTSAVVMADGTKTSLEPTLINHQRYQVLWHLPEGNSTGIAQDIYPWCELKILNVNLQPQIPGAPFTNMN